MNSPRDDLPAAAAASAQAPHRLPAPHTGRGVPEATVARLPVYLRSLTALVERGVATVSSEELALEAGVNSAKLRKDLSHLGSYGTRGVGYDCEYLVYQISRELGLAEDWRVVIVGIGNLGHALANYGGLRLPRRQRRGAARHRPRRRGRAGRRAHGPAGVRARAAWSPTTASPIGVIATPGPAAQDVCDRLVAGGVTSILNFAPTVLQVPDDVVVRRVDLSTELQILAFHEQRRLADRELADRWARARRPGRCRRPEVAR